MKMILLPKPKVRTVHLYLTSKQPKFCRVHKFLKKLYSKTLELYLKTDLDTTCPQNIKKEIMQRSENQTIYM